MVLQRKRQRAGELKLSYSPAKALIASLIWTTSLLIGGLGYLPAKASEAVEINTRLQAEELEALGRKNELQWSREARTRAADYFYQAAELWLDIDHAPRAAECLRRASQQHTILSNNTAAEHVLHKALSIERATEYATGRVQTLSHLALVAITIGKLSKTKRLLDEAKPLLGTDAVAPQARALNALATAEYAYYKRDFAAAINLYDQSVRYWQAANDRLEEARALVPYAYALLANQDPFTALAKAQEAESIFSEMGDRRGLALSRIAIGHIYSIVDDKQRALEAYQKANVEFPVGIDAIEKGRLSNGLGLIFEDHGDWQASLNFRKQALESFRLEGYPHGQLSTLPSLINLSYLVGDGETAADYFREAERLSNTLGNEVLLAVARSYVADHLYKNGSYDEAERLYEQAIHLLEKHHLDYQAALLRVGQGKISLLRGDPNRARNLLTTALRTHRRIRSKFGEAQVLFELAELEASENNYEQALTLVTDSVSMSDVLYSEMSLSGLQSRYYSGNYARYSLLVELLMKSPSINGLDSMRAGLRAVEKARARMTLETILRSGSDAALGGSPAAVQKEKKLLTILNLKLDALTDALSSGTHDAVRSLEGEIVGLRSELDMVRAELAMESPIYSTIKNPPEFELDDFQANVLDDKSVLIEFFLGKDESYLWFIGKGEFRVFVLPDRGTIEGQVDELRGLLEARRPVANETPQAMMKRVTEADSKYVQMARALSNTLLGPIADKLEGKRLIIVPDGKLHNLGISSLPLPNSDSDEPILITNEVVYQPSAQTLSLLTKFRSTKETARDLLVFSDPVFSKSDSRLESGAEGHTNVENMALSLRFAESLEGLHRLPASGEEARSISAIVGGDTDIYSAFGATREQLLKANLGEYKIIHLATHGLVDQERPELSAVVLSRFDEAGRPIDESVRLQDIYAMKLNADLVVLSACQTAAGKEIKGEGVMGLNNAFLQAGARSVVASLWQVEDNATHILMREFYRGLADGRSVSSALRDAQLVLYRDPQYRSPFFWAAFTIQGDMNRRPAINSRPSPYWLTAVPALFVIVLLVWRRFGRNRKVATAPAL